MKRFNINEHGVGTYIVQPGDATGAGAMIASIDLEKVFGWKGLSDLPKKAIAFAVGHVLRNATAGKMETIAEAFKAVQERAKALQDGKWASHKEAGEGGESRDSLLSRALAIVMSAEPKDAAEFIVGEIRTAMEEKNIDPETESDDLTAEQKTERRKIANAVRKSISEDPAVSVQLTKLKADAAAAKAAEALKNAEGKVSKFA